MPDARTVEQIKDELRRIIAIIEELTGLPSRWRGTVRIIEPQEQLLLRQPFVARKDWDCGVSLAAHAVESSLRWRSLIHEALHSVSAGLTPQDYAAWLGWEEAVVEALQRLWRPEILVRLGVPSAAVADEPPEDAWLFERYLTALRRIAAEFAGTGVSETEFFQTLLAIPLKNRKSEVFAWGRRSVTDFERFKRVYAAASGILSR